VTRAKALACKPKSVFFDGLAAFLDPEKRQIAAAQMAKHCRKWTSHYPSELPPAERLYVLRDGLEELSNTR
jgi:ABC-type multidrug transport system ATPase subunit